MKATEGALLPGLLLISQYSLLRGTTSLAQWGEALSAYYGHACLPQERRGGNYPASSLTLTDPAPASSVSSLLSGSQPHGSDMQAASPQATTHSELAVTSDDTMCWAAMSDEGDLAGLPQAWMNWGAHRAVPAATLAVHFLGVPPCVLVALADSAQAYRSLCQILSLRHEQPERWLAWQQDRLADSDVTALMAHILVLCPEPETYVALRSTMPRLLPHARHKPWTGPDVERSVAMPLLYGVDRQELTQAHLVRRLAEQSGHYQLPLAQHEALAWQHDRPMYLSDVAGWLQRFNGHAKQIEQVERGWDLLQSCHYRPGAIADRSLCFMPPCSDPDPDATLREACLAGCSRRYPSQLVPLEHQAALQRLDHELAIISRKGFSSYILAVWRLTQHRRTCGRGSAASSLVCYVLEITNVDPLQYQLVFERFLNDERRDPPDIDIDFPWDERDAVHQQVLNDYGREHVAMVATHQSLSLRGATREAGRLHGKARADLTEQVNAQRQSRRFGQEWVVSEGWQDVAEDAALLTGQLRCWGLHCGGVVITEPPIRDIVPIHGASKQLNGVAVPAIAWEKDGAEAVGLVKIDLLGNRSLAVVRDAVQDLAAHGMHIDEVRWRPAEDPLTKRLIERGKTIGCFYIESPAMRLLNARAGVIHFDRLVLHSSIIRPAANHWIQTYLERVHYWRQTGEQLDEWYPHPALRELLSDSFGILSYQEDVMLIARELADFSIIQQDKLRKALGRSDTPQRLAELEPAFAEGCRQRQVSLTVRNLVWQMITSFAGYSFCARRILRATLW